MMEDLKRRSNYVVIPSNGSSILGSHPPAIKNDDHYMNENFKDNIRVFSPYKVFSPKMQNNDKKPVIVQPITKSPEPEDNNNNQGESLFDSLSGTIGAAVIGPVLGAALSKTVGLSSAQSKIATELAKEALHVGHVALEISDNSVKPDEDKLNNSVKQVINPKNNAIRTFGIDGAIPDKEEVVKNLAERESRTKFINLSAQEQFAARHGGKVVFGKNGKR